MNKYKIRLLNGDEIIIETEEDIDKLTENITKYKYILFDDLIIVADKIATIKLIKEDE